MAFWCPPGRPSSARLVLARRRRRGEGSIAGGQGGRGPPRAPYALPPTAGSAWHCQALPPTILLMCSVYKKQVDQRMQRKRAGCTAVPSQSLFVIRTVAVVQ